MADLFVWLVESNLATVAFVLGVLILVLSIIGKIGEFIVLDGFQRFMLSGIAFSILGIAMFSFYFYAVSTNGFGDSASEQSPRSTISPASALEALESAEAGSSAAQTYQPLRTHYEVYVGTGIFEQGTFSDGMATYTETQLWEIEHFDIQRIRPQEYPGGCDVSRYDTNYVWISGSAGMKFTVNGNVVGEYKISDDPHGYMFQLPIKIGDRLCAVDFSPLGYSIILGPDVFWQYDSYCYRGHCK